LKEAPYFGRAIAYWVLNRNRVTYWGNVVTQLLIGEIAVALANSITCKRPPQRGFVRGFVQVGFPSTGSPHGLDSGAGRAFAIPNVV
jgi:hypothetical protein